MANLYDVARRANVSKTLVSRVINGQKGVSPASTERILTAMRELNYRRCTGFSLRTVYFWTDKGHRV